MTCKNDAATAGTTKAASADRSSPGDEMGDI
jgi:hypothetical protein